MQGGLLPMLITAGGAVWVYYLVSVQKGYSDALGTAAGVAAAVLLAAFFTRLKKAGGGTKRGNPDRKGFPPGGGRARKRKPEK